MLLGPIDAAAEILRRRRRRHSVAVDAVIVQQTTFVVEGGGGGGLLDDLVLAGAGGGGHDHSALFFLDTLAHLGHLATARETRCRMLLNLFHSLAASFMVLAESCIGQILQ